MNFATTGIIAVLLSTGFFAILSKKHTICLKDLHSILKFEVSTKLVFLPMQ